MLLRFKCISCSDHQQLSCRVCLCCHKALGPTTLAHAAWCSAACAGSGLPSQPRHVWQVDCAATCKGHILLQPLLLFQRCKYAVVVLQGRGGSTGYDNAVALPARSDSDELAKENTKSTVALRGQAVFSVAKIDTETNEIAGVFESIQPSDTDLGSKAPKDIKITGLWYGQLNQ